MDGAWRSTHGFVCAAVACAVLCLAPAFAHAAVAPPTKTLVFGSDDNGDEGNNTAATLRALGTDTDRAATLPADLSGYRAIWYVEAYSGLNATERDALIAYVNGGGSLYITGERPCCESLNASVQEVLDGTLRDGDVQVGGLGDISGPFTFNTDVTDHVARVPNLLIDFVPHSPGGMQGLGGVNDRNVFASNGSTPVGAVWSEADIATGRGRIALLMDIDWLNDNARLPIIQNLQNFLTSGVSCSNDGPHEGWLWLGPAPTNTPANCSTLTTPSTVSWTAASDLGPVTMEVVATGATASCSSVQRPGNITTTTCVLTDSDADGASLLLTAGDGTGESTRYYHVRPKNDPRNVPVPFGADSDWWTYPDADSDGVPDHWENNGVYVKGKYLDLPGLGASAARRDLFVHYDYQEGSSPTDGMFEQMRLAFASSPLTNPDGSSGVDLHVLRGQSVPRSIAGDFTLPGQRTRLTAENIQRIATYTGFLNGPRYGGAGVPQIFKWMFNFDTTGSRNIGAAYVKGKFGWTAYPIQEAWGGILGIGGGGYSDEAIDFMRASNAVHELGHTLGLLHHGAHDCINPVMTSASSGCDASDPDYLSVMSYSYNTLGVPKDGESVIDYARTNAVNLDWQEGQALGRLTFVPGQWGEDTDFYSASNGESIDLEGDLPEEPTIQDISKLAAPQAIRALIETYELPGDPVFPTVHAPASITVTAGDSVLIPVTSASADGYPTTLTVGGASVLGTAAPAAGGVRYSARAGAAGQDSVLVRAVNEHLSSDPAQIAVAVVAPAGPPAGPAQGSSLPGPGPVVPAGPRPPAARVAQLRLRSGTLHVTALALSKARSSKRCPATAKLTVRSGARRAVTRLKVKSATGGRCVATGTLRLRGGLARSKTVRVTVAGTNLRTVSRVVRAAS